MGPSPFAQTTALPVYDGFNREGAKLWRVVLRLSQQADGSNADKQALLGCAPSRGTALLEAGWVGAGSAWGLAACQQARSVWWPLQAQAG
jgi:hypothetical protein